MKKKCKTCLNLKNLNEFHSNGRGGTEANCGKCSVLKRMNKYYSDPLYREQKKKWAKNWLERMLLLKPEQFWRNRARKSSMKAFSWKELKSVFDNSDKKCHYCRMDLSQKPFHFDHYIPGLQVKDNLVISCPECNMYKGRYDGDSFKNFIKRFRVDNPVASKGKR